MNTLFAGNPTSASATEVAERGAAARYLAPLGLALFVAIFLIAGPAHFTQADIGYAAQAGVPWPGVLVPLSGVLAMLGALSVLVGYRAKLGAWALVVFLAPVTVMMHNFWSVQDPMMAQMQQAMFLKNVSMLGGALLIAYLGAGPVSLDALRAGRAARSEPEPEAATRLAGR